jgi:hypothetical protein
MEDWNKMVYNPYKLIRIFNTIKYQENNCWLWMGYVNRDGYGMTSFNKKQHVLVHRLIFECCNGPIRKEDIIRHKCNNPPCCNPDHLLLGTVQDNIDDRVRENRSAVGSRNNRAVLDEKDVYEILSGIEVNKYALIHQIVKLYPMITRKAIESLLKGESWKYISKDFDLVGLKSKIVKKVWNTDKKRVKI